jgi:hypothetical protein
LIHDLGILHVRTRALVCCRVEEFFEQQVHALGNAVLRRCLGVLGICNARAGETLWFCRPEPLQFFFVDLELDLAEPRWQALNDHMGNLVLVAASCLIQELLGIRREELKMTLSTETSSTQRHHAPCELGIQGCLQVVVAA